MLSSLLILLGFVASIWTITAIDTFLNLDLLRYGIEPRVVSGLVGVPLAPFLHDGFGHALSNTLPLLVLGGFLALQGKKSFLVITFFIILVGGLAVWIIARSSIHVGASGLVFGYFGYLVARGWYDRRFVSIIIAVIALFLYGGVILLSVLPVSSYISWEGHLFGLISGALAARVTRPKREPATA